MTSDLEASQPRFLSPPNLFPVTAKTICHKLGGLQQQRFIFSQFWRQEVQNQGVTKTVLLLETVKGLLLITLPASGDFGDSRLVLASL